MNGLDTDDNENTVQPKPNPDIIRRVAALEKNVTKLWEKIEALSMTELETQSHLSEISVGTIEIDSSAGALS